MRLVIDTNVLVSALHRPESAPGQLVLLAAEGALELFAPDTVRNELERVLCGKLGYTDEEWRSTLVALPVEWIEAPMYAPFLGPAKGAIKDPADVPVVAVALALRSAIVSGDADFHPLRRRVVKTWRPKDAVERPRRRRSRRRPRS